MQPLVSVVMPVYNAELFLAESIDSILAQTESSLELIVSVDPETNDSSQRIIDDYARYDPRIRVVYSPAHGAANTANSAISQANGQFIALCDADDILAHERLSVQIAWLREHNLDLCGGCAQSFGGSSNPIWFPEHHETIVMELFFRCALLPSTVLARREILQSNLYDTDYKFHDYELWTRLASKYKLGNNQRVLAKRRIHSHQISKVLQDQFILEQAQIRQTYFASVFPESNDVQYKSLLRLIDSASCESYEELHDSAQMVITLAQPDDSLYRNRLANKWLQLCLNSAQLGSSCFDEYKRVSLACSFAKQRVEPKLKLMCSARINPRSPVVQIARKVRDRFISSHAPA